MGTVTIKWTVPMRERFRTAYKAAADAKLDSFTFDGHQFVTGYAKYLLQHLDNVLPAR